MEGWYQDNLEDVHHHHEIIDYGPSGVRFNNIPLSKTQVLNELRRMHPLMPRPAVFLRFSEDSYDGARGFAKEIRDTGVCDDEGLCVFQIVGQ